MEDIVRLKVEDHASDPILVEQIDLFTIQPNVPVGIVGKFGLPDVQALDGCMGLVSIEVFQEVAAYKPGAAGDEIFFHVFPYPVNLTARFAAGGKESSLR